MYPDFPQLIGSKRVPIAGTVVERTESGKLRSRTLYEATQYDFILIHHLDPTDYELLMSYYESNRKSSFSFRWQGDDLVYSVMFRTAPQESWLGGNWREVTVELTTVG